MVLFFFFILIEFDVLQVWRNLKIIGEEMASLADGLLKVSQTADEKQVIIKIFCPNYFYNCLIGIQ